MKLVYLVNSDLPTGWAHDIQIMKMCESFAEAGLEVELVTPKRRIISLAEDPFEYYGIKKIFKITKVPCWDLAPGNPSPVSYLLRLVSFLWSAKRYLCEARGDVLYTRELLAGLYFKNFVLELHSLPIKLHFWHYWLLKRVKVIITITSAIKEDLVKYGLEEDKILVASDAVDLNVFGSVAGDKKELRSQLGLPLDKQMVLYAGSLYLHKWKGVDVLLEAVKFFSNDVVLVLVGGEPQEVAQIKEKYQSDGLFLVGRQPHQKIPQYLKASDVLVLPNKKGEKISEFYTSPLKLFEYMASGAPIVASDLSSIREVLNEKNAVLVEPNNPQALAEGINKIFADKKQAERLAGQALVDVKNYTWEKRAKVIIDFIKK